MKDLKNIIFEKLIINQNTGKLKSYTDEELRHDWSAVWNSFSLSDKKPYKEKYGGNIQYVNSEFSGEIEQHGKTVLNSFLQKYNPSTLFFYSFASKVLIAFAINSASFPLVTSSADMLFPCALSA